MQITWDRYRSLCSAIKCLLEITADDYFVTSNGWGLRCNPSCLCSCLYNSTDTGLFTRFMPTKYHHFACFVCLPICLLCSFDCMCKRTTHVRIQEFLTGGVQAWLSENRSDVLFFVLVLNLFHSFYRGCPMVISKKTIMFHGFRGGGATFARGFNFFQGGVQMLISTETHITCDFPWGYGPLSHPLDPHMQQEIHSPEIWIRSQMYGHLHVLHFTLYLAFTASLYGGKICLWWDH